MIKKIKLLALQQPNTTRVEQHETKYRPKLLTVTEAAQELRVSNWLLYSLIRTNQLKTFTIATRRFVASDDLDNFINRRKEEQYAS